MTRDELIGNLSDLKDYHTVTEQICEYLNLDLLRKDSAYDAGSDFRISRLLEYMSTTEVGFSKYIDYTAFAIVANMSQYNMHIPTDEQMLQMLEISGYTAEEMKEYVQSGKPKKASCISSTHLVPSVCLLSRVMADAMMDKSEWQGFKKGKKKKNYTPVPNLSMQKFQNLVEYMDKNGLLYLDSLDSEEYSEFVCNHSRYMFQFSCIHEELASVSDAVKQKQREFTKEADREMARLFRKKPKGHSQNGRISRTGGTKTAPFAPLAAPAASIENLPSIQEISSVMQPSKNYFPRSREMDLESLRDIPPELASILKRMEQFDNEIGVLQEKCWALSDQLTEENSDERMEYVSGEFIPGVAMGAFQAILNGDEIYKLKIGRIVMEDLMSMSDMPLPCSFDIELEDEGDWDYGFTECNGKLALPVIKEGECLSFPLNGGNETISYAVPVTAVLSRFGSRPFEAPLYIRKSLIKKFKENGCSDRKARDYAVIIATLDRVNTLNDDYRFASEYPTAGDKKAEESPEETTDIRIEKEIAARKDAERALQQARKDNQICRHEISSLQREIERLKSQLAEKEQERSISNDLDLEGTGDSTGNMDTAAKSVQYPYHTKLRVVLYGGFDVFHRELLKLLPDVRVVEISAHIDVNPIRNADIVFLQINKTDHSGYWTVCDACKNSGVPYIHLNYASAKRCAGVIVEEIEKLQATMRK